MFQWSLVVAKNVFFILKGKFIVKSFIVFLIKVLVRFEKGKKER